MAASWERVHELMVEVGALMDLPEVVELPAEHDYWRVAAGPDDPDGIDVDLDRDAGRLVLSTALGQPRAQGREAPYDTMLAYNGAWREAGGARLALDEPGGEVVLLFDLAAEGLDAGTLGGAIESVREVAAVWRRLVAGGMANRNGADAAGAASGFMLPGAIRG